MQGWLTSFREMSGDKHKPYEKHEGREESSLFDSRRIKFLENRAQSGYSILQLPPLRGQRLFSQVA